MGLHRDEARPPVLIGEIKRLAKLPRIHRRRADVTRFARLHHIVQRFERFFDWHLVIPTMDLVKIDVFHPEPLQARVDRGHDGFARKATGIWSIAPREKDFRRDHQFITLAYLAQGAADDFFACAIGICVRGVEEVNPKLKGARDERTALRFVE